MACTFMIHILFHWSERWVDDILMCSFAVKHTVWIYSLVANIVTGLTPVDLMIQTKNDNTDLLYIHILGWPVFYFIKKCKKEIKYLNGIITRYQNCTKPINKYNIIFGIDIPSSQVLDVCYQWRILVWKSKIFPIHEWLFHLGILFPSWSF